MATLLGVRSDRVSGTNPFEDASIFTSNTASFVEEQIESVSVVAADTLTLAQTAIAELSQLSDVIATLPAYDVSAPILDPNMDVTIDLPDIDAELWGRVDDFEVGNAIDTSNLPSISAVSIPGFSPTPFVISIPDAPNPSDITTPGAVPTAPALTFPAEVIVALPSYPGLEPILIPLFTTPTVDDLDITYPTLTEQNISTTIDWTEPTYTEEVIDEVKAQLSVFFAGGSGIDPVVEESIFARGRDREDEVIKQQEQQATDEWANKGYTAPPGMLVKRIDNIREAGTIKKLGLNREQTIKVFDTEIENLRFSVQQGISAEELFVRMFLAKVERLFEVQRLSIQWQIDLYNLSIQVFQIKLEEAKTRIQEHNANIQTAMIEVEVYKAAIEGEKVKTDMNKNLIDAYTAEIEAQEARVQIYSEQVKAVGVQAGVFNTQVSAYRNEVEAYTARVGADKLRFDAYASRIQGEATKAGILDAEARAYQAQVQGIETGVTAEVAALEGEVSVLEVGIRNYEATIRGLLGRAQAQASAIQSNVAGNVANTTRFVAKTGAEEASSKVEIAAWEGTNRTNIELFKADIVSFEARLERAVKEIELLASTQIAAGDLASTITAGAMAAMHVGATLSGNSGVTASGNDSSSFTYNQSATESCSTGTSVSYSVDTENPPDLTCG